MHVRLLGLALLTGFGPAASAQDGERFPGCDSPEAHQFDFWTGEWEVESRFRQPSGEWVESTQTWRAEEVVGGCVLIDFADGDFFGRGMRLQGMGTRYYNPQTQEWTITWISTSAPGQWGTWTGTFSSDDEATFLNQVETPNGTRWSRIWWSELTEDSAHWEYAVSSDGETWQTVWVMEFTREGT